MLMSQSLTASALELCSYTTKISARDKVSSSGISLISSNTRDSLVLMIQQDRANFHKFNRKDAEDQDDCKFSSPEERAKIKLPSRMLQVSPELIQRMINQELIVKVTILENGLEVVEPSPSTLQAEPRPAVQMPEQKPDTKAATATTRTPESNAMAKVEPQTLPPAQPIKVAPANPTKLPTAMEPGAAPKAQASAAPKPPSIAERAQTAKELPSVEKKPEFKRESKPEPQLFPAAAQYSNEQALLFYHVFSRHYLLAMSLDAAARSKCAREIKKYPTSGFSFNSRMNIIDFFNRQNQSNFGSQLVHEIVLNTRMEQVEFDEFFRNTNNCELAVSKGEFAYELSNNNFGFRN